MQIWYKGKWMLTIYKEKDKLTISMDDDYAKDIEVKE